jgi:hypothetical protein
VILFRDQSNLSTSDSPFFGDWPGSGINRFSAYVLQNSGISLPFFVRFASSAGFPATNAIPSSLVPSGVWTQLSFDINPSQIGVTLFPETDDPSQMLSFYNMTFSAVGRIQIGFSAPAALAHNGTSFTYGLDKVSIATPEPPSWLLVCGVCVAGLIQRRQRG